MESRGNCHLYINDREANNSEKLTNLTFQQIVDIIIRLAVLFFVGMVFHSIKTFRFNFDLGCGNRDSHLSFVQYFYKDVSPTQTLASVVLTVLMLVVFLGAIGGFITSGFLGLFLGAVVLTIGYKLFMIWLNPPNSETLTIR